MSYKNKIKRGMEVISKSDNEINNEVKLLLEKIYSQALEENKKTGQSVESLTYEVLEGVEEGLKDKNKQTEEVLKKIANTITEIIHKSATKNIHKNHINAYLAQERLKDVIEMEKAHLLEAIDACRAYAEDRSHKLFAKSLHKIEKRVIKLINDI